MDYISIGIFSQYNISELLWLIVFYTKKHNLAEYNYKIYNKELIAIICIFKYWRPKFEYSTHSIKVVTKHKNLKYFMTIKELSRHLTHWIKFLLRFDFEIVYWQKKYGEKLDVLIRSGDLSINRDNEQTK